MHLQGFCCFNHNLEPSDALTTIMVQSFCSGVGGEDGEKSNPDVMTRRTLASSTNLRAAQPGPAAQDCRSRPAKQRTSLKASPTSTSQVQHLRSLPGCHLTPHSSLNTQHLSGSPGELVTTDYVGQRWSLAWEPAFFQETQCFCCKGSRDQTLGNAAIERDSAPRGRIGYATRKL